MSRFLLGLSLFSIFQLGWASSSQAQENVDAQRKLAEEAENKAFAFIKNEEWCKATNSFLDAYDSVPEVVYIYNAAKAAEYAKDRKLALQLSLEMMGKFPSSDKQAEINALIQKLSGELTSVGAGVACPRTEKEASVQATPTPQTATPAAPPAQSPEPEAAPAAPPVQSPKPNATAEANGLFAPKNGGLFVGIGAAVGALGVLTLGVSGLSYTEMTVLSAQHATEKQRLLENPSDETLLQSTRDLEAMFTDEQNTYQMSLISGAVITTVGVLSLGFGLYLNSQQPTEE